MTNKDQQIKEVLERGVENIYPSKEALEKVLKSGKKIKLYNGIDPTGKLHIGHGVVLNKLRQFQELGHEVIVLIGDFTATIGDPTDKSSVRQPLTRAQVLKNSKGYKKQVGKILNTKKSNIKFLHNEKWSNKLKPIDMLELASNFSVQRLLERDMFEKRIKEGKTIHLHEFLYPMFQAYDSVTMDVDLEIGGSDQTFNMLAGRTLMKKMKNKEKFVLTTKLLEDPTGAKMSTTGTGMVNLDDDPIEMYGKVMSWTDGMIVPAFEIATTVELPEVVQIKNDLKSGRNPKELKMLLAYTLVKMYHSTKDAIKAEENFKQVFESGKNPDDMPCIKTSKKNIIEILEVTKLASSKSEARRLVKQGGVKVDGKTVSDENFKVEKIDKDGVIIQKGKRHFVKVVK